MGNIKEVQHYEYRFPEESREEMDVETPNGVTKSDSDYNLTNRSDIVTVID